MADAVAAGGAASGPVVLVDVSAVSKPDDAFRCEALRAQMTGRLCAQRHLAKRNLNGKIRNQPEYPGCAACQLGAGVAERVGDLSKLPPRPPPRPIAPPPKAPAARPRLPESEATPAAAEPPLAAEEAAPRRRVRLPVLTTGGAESAPKAEAGEPAESRRRPAPPKPAEVPAKGVETKAHEAPREEDTMSDVKAGRMSAERSAQLRGRVEAAREAAPEADVAALVKAVREVYRGAGEHPPSDGTVRNYVIRARGGSPKAEAKAEAKAAPKPRRGSKAAKAPAKKAASAGTELARVASGRLPNASASWAGSMQLARAQHNIEEMIEVFPDGDRRIIIAGLIVKFGVGFGG